MGKRGPKSKGKRTTKLVKLTDKQLERIKKAAEKAGKDAMNYMVEASLEKAEDEIKATEKGSEA